jgi:hypothetical protein
MIFVATTEFILLSISIIKLNHEIKVHIALKGLKIDTLLQKLASNQ